MTQLPAEQQPQRFQAPDDLPAAPMDPNQAKLARAQRAYQPGYTSPWDADAARTQSDPIDSPDADPKEQVKSAAPARRGRFGWLRLFTDRAETETEPEPTGPAAARAQPHRAAAAEEPAEAGDGVAEQSEAPARRAARPASGDERSPENGDG